MAAAIDDQAMATAAHLEGEGARRGAGSGGRLAGIDDDHGPRRGEALEAAVGRPRQGTARRAGLGEDGVDLGRIARTAPIDLDQTAITQAQRPQHRCHAVDGVLHGRRHIGMVGDEAAADADQGPENGEVKHRTALDVAAVGENLALDLAFEENQGAAQPAGPARQIEGAVDQAPGDGEGARVSLAGAGDPAQVTSLLGQGLQAGSRERRLATVAQERMRREPRTEPLAEDVGPPGRQSPATVLDDPGGDKIARRFLCRRRSDCPEIGQPGKFVGPGIGAEHRCRSGDEGGPRNGIARPRIGWHGPDRRRDRAGQGQAI